VKQAFDILNKRVIALEILVRELREQVAKLAEKPEEPKRGPGRPKKAE
jgi:hypothetical protein